MRKFVLDTNCIIDLEESRANAEYLRNMIRSMENGSIRLAVVAVSASENQRSGCASNNYSVFEDKLERSGLSEAEQLLPIAKWGVFYWNHAIWGNSEMHKMANEIFEILFPENNDIPTDDISQNSAWRNKYCDAIIAWATANYNWDYLVSSDNNFHIHKDELNNYGIQDILYPRDASELC